MHNIHSSLRRTYYGEQLTVRKFKLFFLFVWALQLHYKNKPTCNISMRKKVFRINWEFVHVLFIVFNENRVRALYGLIKDTSIWQCIHFSLHSISLKKYSIQMKNVIRKTLLPAYSVRRARKLTDGSENKFLKKIAYFSFYI